MWAALLLSATVLYEWVAPVRDALPIHHWPLMQADAAVCVLLAAIGIALRGRTHTRIFRLLSNSCVVASLVIAGVTLLQHLYGANAPVTHFLLAAGTEPRARIMSVPVAACFCMVGLSLLIDETRDDWLGHVADISITALVILDIILLSGYIFLAAHPAYASSFSKVTLETLICVSLLAFVQTGRRAPYGFFSVLASDGIGGHFARYVLPLASVGFYLIVLLGRYLYRDHYLPLPYAAGATASALETLLFFVVMFLAHKINLLERDVREMAITDELTGIYNRRGFYLFSNQALRDSRRHRDPVTLVFFDVDGLKSVNDRFGHDIGSALLRDVAALLCQSFRVTDIIGRIGGDEFAVFARGHEDEIASVLERLHSSTEADNQSAAKSYRISYSAGSVTLRPNADTQLDDLIAMADEAMYREKQERRMPHASGPAPVDGAARHPATVVSFSDRRP